VIGPFGGAVAAGRVLGLDGARVCTALSLAGSQSAGTFAQWGTPGVKFHQARGSMAGLIAARLAESSFAAAEEILAAKDGGLLNTYSDGGNPAAITRDLGSHWELERISLRLWPTASSIQGAVSAVFDLISQYDIRPDDIEAMRIVLNPTTYDLHGEMTFQDRFHALLSTRYCASVVLHDRECWLDQFTEKRVGDPKVGAFARDRIKVLADETVLLNGARVEADLTDGRSLVVTRDIPHGDSDDPATLDEITNKFRMAARGVLPPHQCEAALDYLVRIDELHDVDRLLAQLEGA
jgi:2-methylcitrate dehydratase PrpD